MKNNTILDLQSEYLETSNPDILVDLYNNLIPLAFHLLKYKNYYHMTYDQSYIVVHDIVSSIIIRLMTDKKPVIKRNPVSYLQRAVLYASNPSRNNKTQIMYLNDYEGDLYTSNADDPVMEDVLIHNFDSSVMEFIDNRLEGEQDEEVRAELKDAFYKCLTLGKNYRKYLYKLKSVALRGKFESIMLEFQDYLKAKI